MRRWQRFFQRGLAEAEALGYLDPLRQSKRLAASLGWVGRVGTALAVGSVVFTIAVYALGGGLPAISLYEDTYTGPVLGVLAAALLSSCAWAFLLCGAAYIGIAPLALVAAYFTYYGGLLGFGWRDSWWMLLPNLLVIGLVPLALSRQPRRAWHYALAWLLCAGCTFLIFQGTPLVKAIPFVHRRLGALALGAAFALLAFQAPKALKTVGGWSLPPTFVTAGVASAIGTFSLANLLAPGQFAVAGQYLVLAFSDLLFLVSLFWFAWGMGLLDWSMAVTRRVVSGTQRLFPHWLLSALTLLWWAAEVYLGRVVLHDMNLELGQLSLPLSFAWAETLATHSWLTSALLLMALLLLTLRRLSRQTILILLGFSLLTLLVFYGYQNSLVQLGAEQEQFSLLALAFYAGGFLWDALSGTNILGSDWEPGPSTHPRALLYLGLVLLVAAIATLGILGHWAQFERVASLYPLLGITYLGGPYLLYLALEGQARRMGLERREALGLFLWGLLAAVPMVAVNHSPFVGDSPARQIGANQLVLTLIFLLAVPRALLAQSPHDAEAALIPVRRRGLGFVIGGIALGLGYATFRAYPILLPLTWIYHVFPPAFISFLQEAYHARVDQPTLLVVQDYLLHMTTGAMMGLAASWSVHWGQPQRRSLALLGRLGQAAWLLSVGLAFRLLYEALYAPLRGWPLDGLASASALLMPIAATALCLVLAAGPELALRMRIPRGLVAGILAALLLLASGGLAYSVATVSLTYRDPAARFSLQMPRAWPLRQQSPGAIALSSGEGSYAFTISTYALSHPLNSRGLAEALQPEVRQRSGYVELTQGARQIALADGAQMAGWSVEYQLGAQPLTYSGHIVYLVRDDWGYVLDWWSYGRTPKLADEQLYARLLSGLRLQTPPRALTHYSDETMGIQYDYPNDWQRLDSPQWRGLSKRFEVGAAVVSVMAEAVPPVMTLRQYTAMIEAAYHQAFTDYAPLDQGEGILCSGPAHSFGFTYRLNGAPMRGRALIVVNTQSGQAFVLLYLAPAAAYDAAWRDVEQTAASLRCG